MNTKKHYYRVRLNPTVPGVTPPNEYGMTATATETMPASAVAMIAAHKRIPEADRDKYEISVQHMGAVDCEA